MEMGRKGMGTNPRVGVVPGGTVTLADLFMQGELAERIRGGANPLSHRPPRNIRGAASCPPLLHLPPPLLPPPQPVTLQNNGACRIRN